jgi:hypothetical protein
MQAPSLTGKVPLLEVSDRVAGGLVPVTYHSLTHSLTTFFSPTLNRFPDAIGSRGEGTEEASMNFQFLFNIRSVGYESCNHPMYSGAWSLVLETGQYFLKECS